MVSSLIIVLVGSAVAVGLLCTWFSYVYKKMQNALIKENKELEDNNNRVVSQKKSSEVRLGRIGENMAPFFEAWPYDSTKFKFIGDPIDGIQFTDDAVILVEIKTGKARLTTSQKKVKELVKKGAVKFATFRVSESGCTLKIEDDDENFQD
jgi:predicted Holliday junction resolvase-like endonuclease